MTTGWPSRSWPVKSRKQLSGSITPDWWSAYYIHVLLYSVGPQCLEYFGSAFKTICWKHHYITEGLGYKRSSLKPFRNLKSYFTSDKLGVFHNKYVIQGHGSVVVHARSEFNVLHEGFSSIVSNVDPFLIHLTNRIPIPSHFHNHFLITCPVIKDYTISSGL